jgi:hypothetical protein
MPLVAARTVYGGDDRQAFNVKAYQPVCGDSKRERKKKEKIRENQFKQQEKIEVFLRCGVVMIH